MRCLAAAGGRPDRAKKDDARKDNQAASRRAARLSASDESPAFSELFRELIEEEEEQAERAEDEEMTKFMQELGLDDEDLSWPSPSASPQRATRGSRDQERERPLISSPQLGAKPLYDQSQWGDGEASRAQPVPKLNQQPLYRASPSGGVETANLGGTLVTLLPTKVMVFIDGTWLFYSLFGRGHRNPIASKFGPNWQETHTVDFSKLPQIISDHISSELIRMQPRAERAVEVVRVLVFSSFREESAASPRRRMFRAMQALNFEVHLGSFTGGQARSGQPPSRPVLPFRPATPGSLGIPFGLPASPHFLRS